MVEMVPFLLQTANQTEPSCRIIAGDVAMREIVAELVLQWWFSLKR
jgi:hypothetical protein